MDMVHCPQASGGRHIRNRERPAESIIVVCNDGDYFIRHRRAVVDRLARDGLDVHVMAGGEPIKSALLSGWTYGFLPIERFAFRPWRDLRMSIGIGRAIAARKPTAIHLITLKPVIFGGIAAVLTRLFTGTPERILMTIPGLGRLMSPDAADGGIRNAAARFMVRRMIRFLSKRRGVRFTFESTRDRDSWLLAGLIGKHTSFVIKGAGVDPKIFRPAIDGAPDRMTTVLFASRLLKAKGLDAFIETARHFAGRGDVRFLVAGMVEPHDPDGYRPQDLQAESAISFIGEVRDMAGLLRETDLVCLPTRYGEGIPRILIEAAACGVACLASDIDGCREVVSHGVNGTLVPVSTPSQTVRAMVEALRGYLDHPETLQAQGRKSLEIFRKGGFDEEEICDRFVALILDR